MLAWACRVFVVRDRFAPRLGGGGGMSAGGYGDPAAGGVGVSCDDRASEVDHPVVVGAQQDQI